MARRYIVDLDADPLIPETLSVAEHRKGGNFEWNPAKVSLYLSSAQDDNDRDRGTPCYTLRKELANAPVFNANLLDFLLSHPNLIPVEWRSRKVCFWGTIYQRTCDNHPCVRCLCWNGDDRGWGWLALWLDQWLRGSFWPAAIQAD